MSIDLGSMPEIWLLRSTNWLFWVGDTGVFKFEDKVDVEQIN